MSRVTVDKDKLTELLTNLAEEMPCCDCTNFSGCAYNSFETINKYDCVHELLEFLEVEDDE